jgi:hypothetical protein
MATLVECLIDIGGSGMRVMSDSGNSLKTAGLYGIRENIKSQIISRNPTKLTICISGSVRERIYDGWLKGFGISSTIVEELEAEFGIEVFMEGDAVCWAAGLTDYFSEEVGSCPCICLAFGTGIASGIVDAEGGIMPLDLLGLPTEILNALSERCDNFTPVDRGIHQAMAHLYKEHLLKNGCNSREVGRRLAERWNWLTEFLLRGAEEPWCVLIGGGLANLVDISDLCVSQPHKILFTRDQTLGMRGAYLLSGFSDP